MTEHTTFTGYSRVAETFFARTSQPKRNFQQEAEALLEDCLRVYPQKPLWLKFHVSDVTNQAAILRKITRDIPALVSIIGQAPANGAHAALEAYGIGTPQAVSFEDTSIIAALKHYRLAFFNTESLSEIGSGPQMRAELEEAERILQELGGNVEQNLQRTWIYCRDIDNNYSDLVTARRELFQRYGLTTGTHYIASTGIEGLSDPFDRLVRMDSFALFGHQPAQIHYMRAPRFLSPTHVYGVTFERGTRIVYGDRSHYFISGTASIDSQGKIVHPGNVELQAERMLENVDALLSESGGMLQDLKQAVVYLRDPADAPVVEEVLAKNLPENTVRIMVKGTVCRPGWLVEMEGIAVNENGDPDFPDFE